MSPSDSLFEFSALSASDLDESRKASNSVLDFSSVEDKSAEFFLEFSSSLLSIPLSCSSLIEISISRDNSPAEFVPFDPASPGEQEARCEGADNKAAQKKTQRADDGRHNPFPNVLMMLGNLTTVP